MFHHAFNLLYKLIWLAYVNKVHTFHSQKKKKKGVALRVGNLERKMELVAMYCSFLLFAENVLFLSR